MDRFVVVEDAGLTYIADEFNRDLVVQGPARPRGWSIVMKPYRVDR